MSPHESLGRNTLSIVYLSLLMLSIGAIGAYEPETLNREIAARPGIRALIELHQNAIQNHQAAIECLKSGSDPADCGNLEEECADCVDEMSVTENRPLEIQI